MSEPSLLATRTLDRCLACGSKRFGRLPLRYQHRGSFPAVECRDCGIRFLIVQPTPASLRELYASEYFERDYRCGRGETAYSDERAFVDENRGLLDDFASLGATGRLLEIGCAGGWLLKHAAQRGWKVQGVELSEDAVAAARKLGLEVHHGDLVSAALADASFGLIYMGDVLEHVPDCRAELTEAARVLAPGGLLYLRGPITTNSMARRLALLGYGALGREIVLREPPYHLWEFTPGSLRRLFAEAGFEVIRFRQAKIPPGQPHGEKSRLQRAAMGALDTLNLPITRAFNVLGDRVVMVGKKH